MSLLLVLLLPLLAILSLLLPQHLISMISMKVASIFEATQLLLMSLLQQIHAIYTQCVCGISQSVSSFDPSQNPFVVDAFNLHLPILILGIAVFFVLIVSWGYNFLEKRFHNKVKHITNAAHAHNMLKSKDLAGRAVPNQRLEKAFGIDNLFTTSSQERHLEFLKQVMDLLQTNNRDWRKLVASAAASLQKVLTGLTESGNENGQGLSTNLTDLVQTLTFLTIMAKFFSDIELPSSIEEIAAITHLINELSAASKDPAAEHSIDFQRKKNALYTLLLVLFKVDAFPSPAENPLNVLLPAHETLWRVALRLYLEVAKRCDAKSKLMYTELFLAFLKAPSLETLMKKNANGVSLKNIIDEALRLYPPTRRIYRAIPSTSATATHAIDVEAIHRDKSIWDDDALVFSPARWNTADSNKAKQMREAFMPFGAGSFECPARPAVAPMMIAILVGTLIRSLQGWEIENAGNKMKCDGLLCAGRSGMESLIVVKVSEEQGADTYTHDGYVLI